MTNVAFPYPGNKARHAEWILQYIPDHKMYVELFGGAAGVLFNKPRSKLEIYNDRNADIPHFFRVLRDECDELQEWLRNVAYSREVYDEWADAYYDGYRPDDDIERAGRFFTLRYMQFGGRIDSKAGFARRNDKSSQASSFVSKTESLSKFRDRLRGVTIESEHACDLIERRDSPTTVFYADPPYEKTESMYNTTGFDHRELAEKAREIEGLIILSYDSIPRFYGDEFTVVSKDSTFAIDGKNDDKTTTEYLIMNFDSDSHPRMSDVEQHNLTSFT